MASAETAAAVIRNGPTFVPPPPALGVAGANAFVSAAFGRRGKDNDALETRVAAQGALTRY